MVNDSVDALKKWSNSLTAQLSSKVSTMSHDVIASRDDIEVPLMGVFFRCLEQPVPKVLYDRIERSVSRQSFVVHTHLRAIAIGGPSTAEPSACSQRSLEKLLATMDCGDLWLATNAAAVYLRDLVLCQRASLADHFNTVLSWLAHVRLTTDRGLSLEEVGIASHLQPFSILTGRHLISLNVSSVRALVAMQAPDGLFYPVKGGGACPELNAINLLIEMGRKCQEARTLVADALAKYVQRILSEIDAVWLPENFRGGPVARGSVSDLLPERVREWITSRYVGGTDIYVPDLWSTFIRFVAFKKAALFLAGQETTPSLDHYTQWVWRNRQAADLVETV